MHVCMLNLDKFIPRVIYITFYTFKVVRKHNRKFMSFKLCLIRNNRQKL